MFLCLLTYFLLFWEFTHGKSVQINTISLIYMNKRQKKPFLFNIFSHYLTFRALFRTLCPLMNTQIRQRKGTRETPTHFTSFYSRISIDFPIKVERLFRPFSSCKKLRHPTVSTPHGEMPLSPLKTLFSPPFHHLFATHSPPHVRYISYISPICLLYNSYIPAISNRRNIGGIYDIHRR